MKRILLGVAWVFSSCFSVNVSAAPASCQSPLTAESPDNKIKVLFCADAQSARYAVTYDSKFLIEWSSLGFELKGAPALKDNLQVINAAKSTHNERWEQVWGEEHFIDNNYNELRIDLQESNDLRRRLTLAFRVYNDGLGFRYEIPEQENLRQFVIMDELTEFNFVQDFMAWWIPAFRNHRYEQLFQHTFLSEIPYIHTPMTIEAGDLFVSIHEANLIDYASMTLKGMGGGHLKAELVPWADGSKVRATAPMKSSWRTIQIGKTAGDLLTSYLILNLNEPNKLADTSWIKPQKFIGIWWGMHLEEFTWGSGPRHGATTERTREYIDAAKSLGMGGVLIEGWNVGWDGNWAQNGNYFRFTQPYPDFDLNYLASYAKEQNINVIGHHETGARIYNYENQLEDAFSYYRNLGIRTVKTGYVGDRIEDNEWHHGQLMVRHHQLVTERAAHYGIMLDIHEPIKDTGLRRTYPNLMTREGARGNEWDAWDVGGGNPPSHTTILPFTRMLAGPFDFTPGIFDVTASSKPGITRVWTTLAKQLALFVVIYSPVQMAADLPGNYFNHPMFQFIREVPVDWETTRVLNSAIGDYATVVRKERNGHDWYFGSITDEVGRKFYFNLDFLDRDRNYCAQIYKDAEDADYMSNPKAYNIERRHVRHDTVLEVKLAAGGGQAIRFVADSTCGK